MSTIIAVPCPDCQELVDFEIEVGLNTARTSLYMAPIVWADHSCPEPAPVKPEEPEIDERSHMQLYLDVKNSE